MNILMIYTETLTTFYSFRNALKFISKKSAEPPLGLLTVAALLPKNWQIKLIDVNAFFKSIWKSGFWKREESIIGSFCFLHSDTILRSFQ